MDIVDSLEDSTRICICINIKLHNYSHQETSKRIIVESKWWGFKSEIFG